MSVDVTTLRTFYYTEPLGTVTRRVLSARIAKVWPDLRKQRLVGLGYATPYLRRTLHDAERTLAFMPATQGVHAWPPEGPSVASLVDEDELPLPDASVDRILAVHALENAQDPDEMLHECWRILAPEGRILLVVPNRRGLWASFDSTPFGMGRPYSRDQLQTLLKKEHFEVLTCVNALSMLPSKTEMMLKMATGIERVGLRLCPVFSGVLVVEALKRVRSGLPVERQSRLARALQPVLAPPIPAPPIPAPQRRTVHKSKCQQS